MMVQIRPVTDMIQLQWWQRNNDKLIVDTFFLFFISTNLYPLLQSCYFRHGIESKGKHPTQLPKTSSKVNTPRNGNDLPATKGQLKTVKNLPAPVAAVNAKLAEAAREQMIAAAEQEAYENRARNNVDNDLDDEDEMNDEQLRFDMEALNFIVDRPAQKSAVDDKSVSVTKTAGNAPSITKASSKNLKGSTSKMSSRNVQLKRTTLTLL